MCVWYSASHNVKGTNASLTLITNRRNILKSRKFSLLLSSKHPYLFVQQKIEHDSKLDTSIVIRIFIYYRGTDLLFMVQYYTTLRLFATSQCLGKVAKSFTKGGLRLYLAREPVQVTRGFMFSHPFCPIWPVLAKE